MKRFLVMVLVGVISMSFFIGCGKKGECEMCGQNEMLKEFVYEDGNSCWYCEDCYRMEKLF